MRVLALVVSPVLAAVTACPGAQVRNSSGEVNVTLRRIDVSRANFDKMELKVIVAVENGTASDVSVAADATIAVVGEAPEEHADAPETDSEPKEGEAEEEESGTSGGDIPVDGTRHAGTGGGRAAAFKTSELPIVVEMPLPSDPALLERILNWKKMLVHVEGRVTIGLKEHRIGGHREVAPPRLPDVVLKEAQIASQDGGVSGAGFFKVLIDNKNPFAVTVDRFSYTITIKDKALPLASGINNAVNDQVPASAVAEYEATVDVDEKAFGKELRAILKSASVPYVVEGELEVRGIKKAFRFAGEMKFAR